MTEFREKGWPEGSCLHGKSKERCDLCRTVPELLASEERIISSLSAEERAWVLSKETPNLTKQSAKIVAFRSEDLIHFLECVKQGFIPVSRMDSEYSGYSFMSKAGDENEEPLLFTTPNTSNARLQKMIFDGKPLSTYFSESHTARATVRNSQLYSGIAAKQGIFRLMQEAGLGADEFSKALLKADPSISDGVWRAHDGSVSVSSNFWETFFTNVIIDGYHGNFDRGVFVREIQKKTGKDVTEQLRKIMRRSSIMIGFNDQLLLNYRCDPLREEGAGQDLVFHIPEKKLPLDTIEYFEALGEFEDNILDFLRDQTPSE